jgi:biopolymer transport protein ExbB/TolQ
MAHKDDDRAAAEAHSRDKDSKEIAKPKDEVGPYVPDKRGYFAGVALSGIMANAALHRAPNAANLALKAADSMLEEMRKPPPLPDEELQQQQAERLAEQRERNAKERVEQEAGRQKQDQERDKQLEGFAQEAEKAEKAERERATALQ